MQNHNVVVTGAAGSLGKATANTLTGSGYAVFGIDHADPFPVCAAFAFTLGGIDLTSPEQTAAAFGIVAKKWGSIHALVNIAGGFAWETVENGTLGTWERLYQINVVTALNSCKAALPLLLTNGGAIVNGSATATYRAEAGMGAYTAAKSGVSRLTESLAQELKDRGVRVNAVLPSIIDTPVNRLEMPKANFSKWVKLDALADVIRFLLSEQARAVTGALLPVTAVT
jgi:NAD(P)-dependent dehydrogenase (short-subunit alcohol dehydrogenase family)